MSSSLTGKSDNISRKEAGDIIGDAVYFKEKNGKHIYKDRYSDVYYLVYTCAATLDTFTVEKWKGQCSC